MHVDPIITYQFTCRGIETTTLTMYNDVFSVYQALIHNWIVIKSGFIYIMKHRMRYEQIKMEFVPNI